MSEAMNIQAILDLEADHYDKGLYQFEVSNIGMKTFNSGRKGVNLTLKIKDTEVLKGDRVPLGETLFKTFFFPTEADKPNSRDFMGRMIQEFLVATRVAEHPDYSSIAGEGIDSEGFWELTIGATINAMVDWTEKKQKNAETGKYEPTGDMEQTIKKFKAVTM